MEELSYILIKDFVSCVHVCLYFFTAAHFHLTASISYFSHFIFMFFFQRNRLPSSVSVIHVSVNIKNNIKKDKTLLVFFLSLKVRAVMRFSSVAFGLPYLLIELFYISVPVVRTDGRSVGQCMVTWLPNVLGWVDLLSYGVPLLPQSTLSLSVSLLSSSILVIPSAILQWNLFLWDTSIKGTQNFVPEKCSHNLCFCYLCWRNTSIPGKGTLFLGSEALV